MHSDLIEELKSHGVKVVMEPSTVGLGKIAKVWDPNDISIYVMDVNDNGEDSGARVTHIPNKIKVAENKMEIRTRNFNLRGKTFCKHG